MIIPSETKQQTEDTLNNTLDNILEKALAEIPLRVIPVVPQGNRSKLPRRKRRGFGRGASPPEYS